MCAGIAKVTIHDTAFKRFKTGIGADNSVTVIGLNNIVTAITITVNYFAPFFGKPVVFV
jgi:hypothetical protein